MARLVDQLGGSRALGQEIRSDLELVDAIQCGLSSRVLDHVLEAGALSAAEAHRLVGSRPFLQSERDEARRLSPVASDRLARVVRVVAWTEEVLGSKERAHRWLREQNPSLGGRCPLDLLASDLGARLVEDLLGRIEHGLVS